MAKKKSKKTTTQAAGSSTSPSFVANSFVDLNISAQVPPQPKLTRTNIVAEFERYFGNFNKLANWQRLCSDVGVDRNLPSIAKCRQALKGVWVNIYDLIDAVRSDSTPPHRFPSQKALAKYTINRNKIYPKKKAKEGGPVRALLAHIFY